MNLGIVRRTYGLYNARICNVNIQRSLITDKKDRLGDLPPSIEEPNDLLQPNYKITFRGRNLQPRLFCSHKEQLNPKSWVETLSCNNPARSNELKPLGYVDLHPDIFSIFPRLDIIHKNLYWQAHYRVVDWRCITTRADLVYRSQRKPWPQKKTGRARHGNRRTHIWIGGGQCNGPRGPHSYFSLLPYHVRVKGLLSSLTVKHAQDDLRIVNDFRLSDELEKSAKDHYINKSESLLIEKNYRLISDKSAQYLREYVDAQNWGPSVLFITDEVCEIPDLTIFDESEALQLNAENLPKDIAIRLACASYSDFINEENSSVSSITEIPAGSPVPAPRAVHPGRGLTLMPLDGLNVWSMVYHDTVVMTVGALEKLEKRLLKAQKAVMGKDESGRDMDSIKAEADWLIDEDFATDDVDHDDLRRERHFSGSIGDFAEIKRKLS